MGARGGGGEGRKAPLDAMASSYAHAMERQALLPARLDGPAGLDNLQAKKNFSVSHLLDLEEAGDMVAAQADEGGGEPGRSLLESPGLTSGSDTPQQDSKCGDTPPPPPNLLPSLPGARGRRGRSTCAALRGGTERPGEPRRPLPAPAGGVDGDDGLTPAGKRPEEPAAGPWAGSPRSPSRPSPLCPVRGARVCRRRPPALGGAGTRRRAKTLVFPQRRPGKGWGGSGGRLSAAVPRSSGPAPRCSVSLRGTRRRSRAGQDRAAGLSPFFHRLPEG